MKMLWWVVIAAFFLGMGVGTGVAGWMVPKGGTVPAFSSEPEQMQNVPSQPSPTEESRRTHPFRWRCSIPRW